MKIKKSISLSRDTAERLGRHAAERHTSVSQLITDWVWQASLSDDHRTAREPVQTKREWKERIQ